MSTIAERVAKVIADHVLDVGAILSPFPEDREKGMAIISALIDEGANLPGLVEACEVALEYIGDDDGTCITCGGDGESLDYHKECPCKKIRAALAKAKGA